MAAMAAASLPEARWEAAARRVRQIIGLKDAACFLFRAPSRRHGSCPPAQQLQLPLVWPNHIVRWRPTAIDRLECSERAVTRRRACPRSRIYALRLALGTREDHLGRPRGTEGSCSVGKGQHGAPALSAPLQRDSLLLASTSKPCSAYSRLAGPWSLSEVITCMSRTQQYKDLSW
ncbi:hypothetical protein MTO96_013967 [Rhipicephalus appendiculatus]